MTMANSTVASPMRSSASLRKTNKPLMEKRRRARINDSLSQLKSLVITGTKKDSSQFNKLEKADILELTVKHLRNLQSHQQQQQQQQQQMAGGETSGLGPRYQDGFLECANEVIRYLGQSQGFSEDTKCRVVSHLASCIQLAKTKTAAMQASALAAQPAGANMNTAILSGAALNTSSAAGAVPAQGQIIQIVSGPALQAASGKPQNVHILPSPILNNNNNSSGNCINITAAPSTTSSSPRSSAPQQIPAPHYAQPLHIQIPPAFSPVLVNNSSSNTESTIAAARLAAPKQQQQQQQQHHQPMDIAPRPAAVSPVRSLPSVPAAATSAYLPGKPQKQQAEPRGVLTATVDSTPNPHHTRLPSPPAGADVTTTAGRQQQQQQLGESPITHVHKIHGFYSSAEDFVPSRQRTFSVTSSSSTSSSSSSSTENELSSPLNLSQSPSTCATEATTRTRLSGKSFEVNSAPKPRYFMDTNNNNNNSCNDNVHYYNKNISYTMGPASSGSDSSNSDQENNSNISNMNINHNNNNVLRAAGLCPATTKPGLAEPPALKYMSMMMDEDRQWTRNQGHRSRSTSPASSVGEDRLWRPW